MRSGARVGLGDSRGTSIDGVTRKTGDNTRVGDKGIEGTGSIGNGGWRGIGVTHVHNTTRGE